MMYKLIPMCKKCLPKIFHNTDSLKRGVLRRILAQSITIENIEQQQAVELVAAELVSDTSKQVSLRCNFWAEKVTDPDNVVLGHIYMYWQIRMPSRHCHLFKVQKCLLASWTWKSPVLIHIHQYNTPLI